MNKVDYIHQTAHKINNFDLIISIISISDLILYQINKLIDIYVITSGECLFILNDIVPQTETRIFILLFQFNASLYDNNLLLFHLITMIMDEFDFIVAVINSTITIMVLIDDSFVFLIMVIDEFLIMVVGAFKLIFVALYINFSLDIDKNWF